MNSKITAKDGLLWTSGKIIRLPAADTIARQRGFSCAERLVKYLMTVQAQDQKTAKKRKEDNGTSTKGSSST
jgi:hypothetical protein